MNSCSTMLMKARGRLVCIFKENIDCFSFLLLIQSAASLVLVSQLLERQRRPGGSLAWLHFVFCIFLYFVFLFCILYLRQTFQVIVNTITFYL